MTLHNLLDLTPTTKSAIRHALERLLEELETNDAVHGDLRPNNIMVYVDSNGAMVLDSDGSARIKAIDFDWAGRIGSAWYPFTLNTEIEWPGKPGAEIGPRDDRKMVESWLPSWAQDLLPST